MKSYSKGQLKK